MSCRVKTKVKPDRPNVVGGAKETHRNIILLWKLLSWLRDQFLISLPNSICNFIWLNVLNLGCKIKITWVPFEKYQRLGPVSQKVCLLDWAQILIIFFTIWCY